jgi:hypothetical protein
MPANRFASIVADHQNVVGTRGRHFEGALRRGLPAHIGEVEAVVSRTGQACIPISRGRCKLSRLLEQRYGFGQMPDAVHGDALDDGCFGGVVSGNDQAADALGAGTDGNRECAAHTANGSVERQFPGHEKPFRPAHDTHRTQDAHGHGKIETGSLLAYVRGSEIDSDSFIGIAEAGVEQGGFDPLAALPNRRIRHSHGDEVARRARRVHVDFDIDQVGIDAVNGGAACAEQRHIVSVYRPEYG